MSDLVGNPEDQFSRVAAQIWVYSFLGVWWLVVEIPKYCIPRKQWLHPDMTENC